MKAATPLRSLLPDPGRDSRRKPVRAWTRLRLRGCILIALASVALVAGSCRYTPRVELDGTSASHALRGDAIASDADAFFRDPYLTKVEISPDGQRIAGIRSTDGVQAILTVGLGSRLVESLGAIEISDGEQLRHFSKLGWASNRGLLASIESRLAHSGPLKPRKTRLFLAELGRDRPRYVGPNVDVSDPLDVIARWQQFQDDIIHWLPDDPDAVLVDFKGRAKRFDLRRGRYSEVRGGYMSKRVGVQWLADHAGRVRAAYGTREWGTRYLLFARRSEGEGFEQIAEYDLLSEQGLLFAGFSEDPARIHVFKENERGRAALHSYTLPEGPLGPALYSHPDFDLRRLRTSVVDGRAISVEYDAKRPEVHYFDESWRRAQQRVDAQLPRRVNRFVSVDRREERALVLSSGPQAPPRYYVLDRESAELSEILETMPELPRTRLSPMRPVEYRARDGQRIPAYLTIPRGREAHDLPLVVLVHAGPAERVVWDWDPLVQFLAAQGFAVFQPNFRGSAGYGRDYRQASHGRWGLEMQSDISDGVRWLIERGVADAKRIAIFGRGYGGYSALLEAARNPQLYRAVASFGAMTDLIQTLADEDRGYGGSPEWNRQMIGDRFLERGRLLAASPLHLADRIQVPVLLGHGADDPRVSVDQLERMAAALEEHDPPPEVYVYAGELDEIIDERARIDFHTRLGRFFERHLGTRGTQAAKGRTGASIR